MVLIVTQDAHGQPLALASGFFVRDTVVATNLHVVEGAASATARVLGETTAHAVSGVLNVDTLRDLALLVLTGARGPTLPLGNSGGVAVGDEVFAVGNPEGLEGTLSQGIISGIRKIEDSRLLQMTAPISPGSSGGPVLNARGLVVGISVGTFREGQNLNFAIPVEYLSSLLAQRQSLQPLSAVRTGVASKRRAAGSVGAPTKGGVEATAFEWELFGVDGYSFSVRNNLQRPVTRIRCLVVFYDSDRRPVDFKNEELQSDTIPPGLALRYKSETSFPRRSMNPTYKVSKHVEIRVLDFTIVH